MYICRACEANCDPSNLINGVCDDCRAQETMDKNVDLMAKSNNFKQLEMNLEGVDKVRKIRLISATLKNYKCFADKHIDFSDKTLLKGASRQGKSVIRSAYYWLMHDKDEYGNAAKDIRPHDNDGVILNNDDIEVTYVFDIDGRKVAIKKIQKMKFVKSRETGELRFDSNENLYEINEIPKKPTEFKQYIAENFCSEDLFMLCTNIRYFLNKSTKDRTDILNKGAGKITDSDVITENSELSDVANMLFDGNIDELTSRSTKKIKQYKERSKEIDIAIKVENQHRVEDVVFAELELVKNTIKESINDKTVELNNIDKQFEEYFKASGDVLSMKFELNDMERKANEELFKKRNELEDCLFGAKDVLKETERRLDVIIKQNTEYNEQIADCQKKIELQANKWKIVKDRKLDDSSLVCPYCKQSLPEDAKASNIERFEAEKNNDLESIEKEGKFLRSEINKYKNRIFENSKIIADLEKEIETTKQHISNYEYDLRDYPSCVDMSDNKEYAELKNRIAEKEDYLSKCDSAESVKLRINDEIRELQHELESVNTKLSKASINDEVDEKIANLSKEKREIEQKSADEERILFKLGQFTELKNQMITEQVNKLFDFVKWRLFIKNNSGANEKVCQILVDGSNYETCLNHGDRILADIDILSTFQKINDISLPIWVDDIESTDKWRIPDIDGQLIMLEHTTDKQLIVTDFDKVVE